MRWYLLIGAAALLSGCAQSQTHTATSEASRPAHVSQHRVERTLHQFQFLQPDMLITEVTNQVGLPDLEVGYGQISWIYRLADDSTLTIVPKFADYGDLATWRIAYFCQYHGTNLLWMKPEGYK